MSKVRVSASISIDGFGAGPQRAQGAEASDASALARRTIRARIRLVERDVFTVRVPQIAVTYDVSIRARCGSSRE